jgi:hypothetical protein
VLTFTLGDETIALEQRQSIFIRRGAVHSFRNDSSAPATCLGVLTPDVLGPVCFREPAALIAAGPPDPAAVGEIMTRYRLLPVALSA